MTSLVSTIQGYKNPLPQLFGGLWHWLTTDNRLPIQHVVVEHKAPRFFNVWARMFGNLLIAACCCFALAGMLGAVAFALVIGELNPEVGKVAQLYVSGKIHAWEAAHGFSCLQWQERDPDGHLNSYHGGPSCPPQSDGMEDVP